MPLTSLSSKEKAMLVLSRKKSQKIMIGDDISIMVIAIQGDQVRLGIAAPKEIPVHRQEVYDAIKREQEQLKGADELSVEEDCAQAEGTTP